MWVLYESYVRGLIPTGWNTYVFYKLDTCLSSAAMDKRSNSDLDVFSIDFCRTSEKDIFSRSFAGPLENTFSRLS